MWFRIVFIVFSFARVVICLRRPVMMCSNFAAGWVCSPAGVCPLPPAEEGFRCCWRGQITARQAGERNQESCCCFRTDRSSSCLLSCQVIWTPRGAFLQQVLQVGSSLSRCLHLFLFSAPAPFSARAAGRPLHQPLGRGLPRSGCHREAPKQVAPKRQPQKSSSNSILRSILRGR